MSTTEPAVGNNDLPIVSDELAAASRPWSWHLQRALAIVLVVTLPVWLLSWLVVPDFGALSIVDLRARWTHPVWRGVDLVVVVAGLIHAALRVHPTLERQGVNSSTRLVVEAVVWTLTAALVVAALNVILTLGV